MKKKKKLITYGISVLFMVGLAFFLLVSPEEEMTEDVVKKELIAEVTETKEEIEEEVVEVVLPYSTILNETQEVLSEVEKEGVLFISVLSTEALSNENILSIMKEASENKQAEIVHVNVFSTKDSYETSVTSNSLKSSEVTTYVGIELMGEPTVQKITHSEVAPSETGHIDTLAYDIQGAKEESNKVTYQVIVSGNESNLESFLNGFVSLHKDMNPTDTNIALELYLSAEQLNAKEPVWFYDGQWVTKKENFAKESSQ